MRRRLRSIPLRRVKLGESKKGQCSFEGRLACVGQVESGGQMALGVQEIAGRGLDLTKEPVGGKANQWLVRCTGEHQGFGCTCSRAVAIVRRSVVARPGESTIGPTKDTAAPGEPAIVRCQPGMSARKVARIEAKIGREALEEQSLLMVKVAGLRRGSVRKESMDLLPGDFRFAAVSAEHAECMCDLPAQVRVSRLR